jgi:hypothetical protein
MAKRKQALEILRRRCVIHRRILSDRGCCHILYRSRRADGPGAPMVPRLVAI